jgi:hypothetical protein
MYSLWFSIYLLFIIIPSLSATSVPSLPVFLSLSPPSLSMSSLSSLSHYDDVCLYLPPLTLSFSVTTYNKLQYNSSRCYSHPSPSYTGLCGGLEHLKIETSLRDERFESVKGVCVI